MAEQTPLLDKIRDFAAGVLKGNTTDLVGAPVDIINTVLKPMGLGTDKPVGGSKHLRELVTGSKAEVEDKSIAETIGTFISPEGLAKAMVVGAARVDKVVGSRFVEDAQELIKGGASKATLYNYTGSYTDKDQKLKAVISDRDATLSRDKFKNSGTSVEFFDRTRRDVPLEEVISHPELFALYPELKSVKVRSTSAPGASWSPSENMIRLGPRDSPEAMRSSLLHEIQHGVQKIEGFTGGGSVEQFMKYAPDEAVYLQDRLSRTSDSVIKSDLTKRLESAKLDKELAVRSYLNIPGEQEARFTQLTRNLDTIELGSYVLKMLRKGDTPQSWNTRPAKPIDATDWITK